MAAYRSAGQARPRRSASPVTRAPMPDEATRDRVHAIASERSSHASRGCLWCVRMKRQRSQTKRADRLSPEVLSSKARPNKYTHSRTGSSRKFLQHETQTSVSTLAGPMMPSPPPRRIWRVGSLPDGGSGPLTYGETVAIGNGRKPSFTATQSEKWASTSIGRISLSSNGIWWASLRSRENSNDFSDPHPATGCSAARNCYWLDRRKLLKGVAPQPGFEPGTLRLTGGTRSVSRLLRNCAGRCRIPLYHS